jgi:RNA polymerase sigma-70 factor (ECF subfamily)
VRDPSEAVTRLAREEGGRVIALLAARFGDLDLADESVQDALVQALETWQADGIPENPAGWLYRVAHNRAIDRLRRTASAARRLEEAAPELLQVADPHAGGGTADTEEVPIVENAPVGDEQLRLMLLCCHPALDRDTQVALTLRLVGGLTTHEIAAAYLLPEATLAQRIVRAKRKIRDARIPLTIPADLRERVDVLLTVLYLIFNEGYLSRGARGPTGERMVRIDLVDEAIRLTATAADLLDGDAEAGGLLALELYHRARMATRLDTTGDLVLLEQQDRTRWDLATIARADRALQESLVGDDAPGPYRLQALIAAHHAHARTADETDWPGIVRLYDLLIVRMPTPVVALNRAVAVAMADGPRAGLAALDGIPGLDRYHLRHATAGELLLRAGEPEAAASAFERALPLTSNAAERRHLERRAAEARARRDDG